MSGLLDKLVAQEADALLELIEAETPPPHPADVAQARRHLLAIHELDRQDEQAAEVIRSIREAYKAAADMRDARRLALKHGLLEYVRQFGRLVLPDVGTCGTRKVPGGLRLQDEAAAEAWALENGKATKQVLDKAAYRDLAETTTQESGELLPGVVSVPDGTTVVIGWAKP